MTEDTFDELVMLYGNSILRMCYMYLKDYQLAEDVTQETFIIVCKRNIVCFKNKRDNGFATYAKSKGAIKNIIEGGSVKMIREQIDNELQHIRFEMRKEELISTKNKRNRLRYSWLIWVCGFLLIGMTSYAGYVIYNGIFVNHQPLPELDPMKIMVVNEMQEYDEEKMVYRKEYDSYLDLCNDIGVELLYSGMADGDSWTIINRESDNEHWTQIKVTAYIVGDVYNLKLAEYANRYTFEEGEVFSSPIDMTIDIISNEEQMKIGWEKEYLGTYEYVETYTSNRGYKVNIIRDTAISAEDKPACKAIFVADGIRYTLSGRVELDMMKEIVNSFHYSHESVKNEIEKQKSDAMSSQNSVRQDSVSDLLYRKLDCDIGVMRSAGTVTIYKELICQEVSNPTNILVVYNDELLDKMMISEDVVLIELDKSGYYGFFVEDQQGEIYDIDYAVYSNRMKGDYILLDECS